ncbi:MAG: hybrid sensor histidine kinase/response regulator, partial [Oxalobacteraceae bacterium]
MDDLLAEFLTEANESLAGLDEALLTLERAPNDVATVGLIFRLVHTIKGTCGFLGLPRLEKVAHSGENVLGLLREGTISATPELVTAVFSAVDVMKEIVMGLSMTGLEPEGDDIQVINRLDAIFAGELTSPTETVVVRESIDPTPDQPIGRVCLPAVVAEPPIITKPGSGQSENSPLDASGSDISLVAQTIRVSVNVLENLMTLVSELVLTRNQLLQISRTSRESRYATPVQRLSQITSDLQEGVMKTRMQPIGSAWSKLPRLVRDLMQDLGKPMELQMIGAETEIDRQVLELVRDPLTHMVRNSADHGLEHAEERRVAGKPAVGTITLNAFH